MRVPDLENDPFRQNYETNDVIFIKLKLRR
jgi:hypothetical protein